MRISTSNQFDSTVATLQRRQSDLADAQERLTSGKRVSRASDDPTAAARAERDLADEQRTVASQRALDASRSAVTQTEGALADTIDLLNSARDQMVAAGNGSFSDSERLALVQQLQGIRGQLLAVANRSDGNGGYLFAGQGASAPPFIDAAGGVQFTGTPGQTNVPAGTPMPITADGRAIWMQANTGNGVFKTAAVQQNGSAWIDQGQVTNPAAINGDSYAITFSGSPGAMTYTVYDNGVATSASNVPYVDGQAIQFGGMSVTIKGTPAAGDSFTTTPSTPTLSVFDTLDHAISALSAPMPSGAKVSQAVSDGLRDLDSVLGRVQSARSAAGELLNRIDTISENLSATKLAAQTDRSNATDLDMVAGISDFQNKQAGYNAALQTYASVQKMSMFQYIGN